ncbi:MAG: hypothetical protein KBT30_00625 [Clostridiales bacterium]|nr:hypothetical protein [Candidatus Apopatousia equi]
MLTDYLFELSTGEYVFVEMPDGERLKTIKNYLLDQLAEGITIKRYVGAYSVEEAEQLGYDTY